MSKTKLAVASVVVSAAMAACSTSSTTSSSSGHPTARVRVVAAENIWGSIAAQLGGDRTQVTSVITNPDTDPHSYEATPADGRAIASASYVILNGVGYDAWASQAVSASPGRTSLDVGKLLGLGQGANPHRWYFPNDVERVSTQITSDLKRLDPADAAYFDSQYRTFTTDGMRKYRDLATHIRQTYGGTPVGASESIFVGLAEATGLDLTTPSRFLTAISEGADPTAADKATVDQQIATKQIKVFVYNSQNSTPDIANLVKAATAHGIPVVTVTETLMPATASFQDWQSRQLQRLSDALAKATGR